MAVLQAAYGYRIAGIEGGGALALRGAEAWPELSVSVGTGSPDPSRSVVLGEHRALIDTAAARLVLEREPVRLTVLSPNGLPDADLVHPCLWPPAAVFARWRGLETLHGGAFVDDRGAAWAVLGDRGAGKSSLLATLALAGHVVLADDLLVLDGAECFAGPRCLDLRPDTVNVLGLGSLPSVRSTQRSRLPLAPCDARFPLRGCLYLEWGPSVAAEPLNPAEHLGRLTGQRRIAGLGANVEQLLSLSGLPAFRLARPSAPESVHDTREAMSEALSRAQSYFSPTFPRSTRT
jgi:hypothetical protein